MLCKGQMSEDALCKEQVSDNILCKEKVTLYLRSR